VRVSKNGKRIRRRPGAGGRVNNVERGRVKGGETVKGNVVPVLN
jgi:hypothetical protein